MLFEAIPGKDFSESPPLKISTEQLIALHSFFAEAVAVGEPSLGDISGYETEVEVTEIRCTSLGEFGEHGMRVSDDLVAGVFGRLEGCMPGSINIVLEPEDALLWAQIGNLNGDALDTFVSLGRVLLEGIATGLSEVLKSDSQFKGATLVEESELMMLVKTHAPSDTLVFSLRLEIDVRDERVSAISHLMIEPKYLTQLLSALSAAAH